MTTNEKIAYKLITECYDELSLEKIASICELEIAVVKSMLNQYQSDLMKHNMSVQTLFTFIQNENFDDAQKTLDLMKIRKIMKEKNIDFDEAEKLFNDKN